MKLDTLPVEILALIILRISHTPCVYSFEYSFTVSNNKPLKPHRVHVPLDRYSWIVVTPFDYFKYQIYSPYLSVHDIIELCCTCKHLKTVIYKIIFTKCAINSQNYYDDLLLSTNPKLRENQSKSKWMPLIGLKKSKTASSVNNYAFSTLKYKTFMENSMWDTNNFDCPVSLHIPASMALNGDIMQFVREFTFTVESNHSNGEIQPNHQAKSIVQLLTPEYVSTLKTLTIIVESDKEWDSQLLEILTENLDKYLLGQTPWLSISLFCRNVSDCLDLCLQYLRDKVRSLTFDNKMYHTWNLLRLPPSTRNSSFGRVDGPMYMFCEVIPYFTNLNKLHCEIKYLSSQMGHHAGLFTGPYVLTAAKTFLQRLDNMPSLDTLSIVSYLDIYNQPVCIYSAPKSLKALTMQCSYQGTEPLLSGPSTGSPQDFPDIHRSGVHAVRNSIRPDFLGLVQLFIYDIKCPPVAMATPCLQSLAMVNQICALADPEYKPLWNTFFEKNGRLLKRLYLSLYYGETEMIELMLQSLPQLIHLEIADFFMPPDTSLDMDKVVALLKNNFPKLCRQLEYLMLPIVPKNMSFKTIHGIANWKLYDSYASGSDDFDNQNLEHQTVTGNDWLFGSLKRVSFAKNFDTPPDEFATNKFLKDFELYTSKTFPYIFEQVDFVKLGPWKIFYQDMLATNSNKQGYKNYMTREMLESTKHWNFGARTFEYHLKMDLLRDISVVPIEDYEKKLEMTVVHEGHEVMLGDLLPNGTEAQYFIFTSKKWY